MQAYVLLHNVMFCFLRIRNIPNHVRLVTDRLELGQCSLVLRIASASIIPAMRQKKKKIIRSFVTDTIYSVTSANEGSSIRNRIR